MEQKLYYQDPYMKSFSAELIKEGKDKTGRLYVVLSQTAFFPTGGGQPFDMGSLNGVQVLEVEEVDGEIRHYISEPLDTKRTIEGNIDWNRRFDHMQQHSGQHILSAAFEELYQYKTVSFHLGKKTLTIDLDTETLTNEEASAAEKFANKVIIENRPIVADWFNEDELKQYKLRKDLSVSENIRLVIIPELDYNGCGGTHPDSTGQVASLKILGWERQKKRVRVEFVCGNRVLEQLEKKHAVLKELTSLLNAPEEEMADVVNRMLDQRRNMEKMLDESKELILSYEAAEIIGKGGEKLVTRFFENRSIQELQKLARLLVSEAEDKVFLLAAENEEKLQFVFARGNSAEGNMKSLANEALALINGKGGGSDSLAQGGGEKIMPVEQFIKLMRQKANF